MTLSQHITALTVVGFYYWFQDNQLGADACIQAAVSLLSEEILNKELFRELEKEPQTQHSSDYLQRLLAASA